MEVHPDEGGVTKTVGGLQWVILPAVSARCWVWGGDDGDSIDRVT